MTITNTLKKMVHRKAAEFCTALPAGNTVAGGFICGDKSGLFSTHDAAVYVGGASAIWNYVADEDAWVQLPNSGIAGTFGAGSCGVCKSLSAPAGNITNTATAGSTTTITTALNIVRQCTGFPVRVVAGTGVGYVGLISYNTMGANSILTVSPASSVAFDNTTQYQIVGGSFWFFNAGAGAVGFSCYDRLTNTWTARSVTNLPTTFGTDGKLVGTDGLASNDGNGFVNGTATAATATTISDTTKTWPSGGWINSQVRIVSGTGAGQIRAITANTSNQLTVATWTVTPDTTSVYRIEGNDDQLFLLGNNAVTMYKYVFSTNTWSTLSPVAARAGAAVAGMSASWVDTVTDTSWNNGLYSNHYLTTILKQNGRYIYSFRGGSSTLDVYDIASNTWVSGLPYGAQAETWNAGSFATDKDNDIYIQKDATGRIYKYSVPLNKLDPFVYNPVPQGAALVGEKMFTQTYSDNGVDLVWLYTLGHTRSELTRWLVV